MVVSAAIFQIGKITGWEGELAPAIPGGEISGSKLAFPTCYLAEFLL
jgi:hypothetical protein